MDLALLLIILTFGLTVTSVTIAVIRGIIDWKLYKGSNNYWDSWEIRSKNIRKKLLEELSDEQLKYELRRRKRQQKKRKSRT